MSLNNSLSSELLIDFATQFIDAVFLYEMIFLKVISNRLQHLRSLFVQLIRRFMVVFFLLVTKIRK